MGTILPQEERKLSRPSTPGFATRTVLEEGKRVLREEAQALELAAAGLDERFHLAVELLARCSGKVITTGVGKSGFIARKIASTMASLGTPAIFLHPTEAVHGDMGVVAPEDVILAISHSGNSEELLAFLDPLGKWLNVPVVAITGQQGGAIDHFATVVLQTGVTTEACTLGLAPTTSSTTTLALGDALAVCTSQVRGIRAYNFAKYHPSGSLGRRLYVQVKEVMRADYARVEADASLGLVVRQITQGRLGLVVVAPGSARMGIITDGDIRRAVQQYPDWATKKASEIMSAPPMHIRDDALAYDALALMEDKKITSLIVCGAQQHIIGVVHLHDILSPVSQRLRPDGEEQLG
jgi:arabinose-5-phosphate isomerase